MKQKRKSLTKGKNMFIIDLILIPVFTLVAYSGLKLHIAGHPQEYSHDIWHNWAIVHVVSGIISLVFGWLHIKAHWTWYNKLFKKSKRKKSKVTITLSLIFSVELITGSILIFFIDGANTGVGLWHYKIGLAMILFLLLHTVNRFNIMMKGLGVK